MNTHEGAFIIVIAAFFAAIVFAVSFGTNSTYKQQDYHYFAYSTSTRTYEVYDDGFYINMNNGKMGYGTKIAPNMYLNYSTGNIDFGY